MTIKTTLIALALSLCALGGCKKRECQDYSYILSRVPGNSHVATCDRGMTMDIEEKSGMINKLVLVHCRCPAEKK